MSEVYTAQNFALATVASFQVRPVPVVVAQNYAMVFHSFNNNISSYLVLLVHSLHSSIIHFRNRLFIFTWYFSLFFSIQFSRCSLLLVRITASKCKQKNASISTKRWIVFFNRHQVSPMCLSTMTNKEERQDTLQMRA